MLSVIHSGALVGVESVPVTIEVNVGGYGELRYYIVGLPDTAVKESMDRVISAIHNSGLSTPSTKTTINLAPGDLRKEGAHYDLPIALGLLAATGQLQQTHLEEYLVAGELSLSGATRPVRGGVALALQARRQGRKGVILPPESAEEAALVEGVAVLPVNTLHAALRFLNGEQEIAPLAPQDSAFRRPPPPEVSLDFAEVKGQHSLRRAVEIAVAGGHNLLMIGPPGSGKSMVARRIPTILPEPTLDEFLEILGIQSAAGVTHTPENRRYQRPFRAPHHTISDIGLIGGGTIPGPGEISLAHHGVLFLDELPEFKRSALEVMRQPLEDGSVTISRANGKITLPSQFMLVAAMNPTPCGHTGAKCRCTPQQIQRYRARISGPLLDRIDIHIEAPELSIEELRTAQPGESSHAMRQRINAARQCQHRRYATHAARQATNACMTPRHIRAHCTLTPAQGTLLQRAMERLELSARAYDRILKVSRTIADLDASETIQDRHLLEAIQYRALDRNLFQGNPCQPAS
ncbi:MAG: YifB family Mg chelatase-like AAA ATPase [Puniceicoccales bacterium]|jgi:magnesium chelatase family protein|nr:YifB family Mg chelatase-like AAA ATPase [Puniceicoccales bacterium]